MPFVEHPPRVGIIKVGQNSQEVMGAMFAGGAGVFAHPGGYGFMGIPPEFSDPPRDEVSTFKIFDFVVEGIKGDFCVARSTTVAFLVLLLSYAYLPLLCWRRPRRIRRR